ncbi:MarR family winged helix-turn-helix transcriptional regulator [Zobellia nedashkovskayae]|uniref:MarR family winged helix-turn-helix transcriptional regulator n=1 Tax=Zobellia nedashkovskayae TaxID=2779510 RepID=UPI001D05A146|nr:MarR family winged helix-turn-helix transcriptional regulator [Zobellia nedashkovskayae]
MRLETIDRIRAFNRYYVRAIGLLENTVVKSGFTLTEAHIINEVNATPNTTATEINKKLKLDEGYLSRVIKKLISNSLLTKSRSATDKRAYVINLTEKGRAEYQKLDSRSTELVASNISNLDNKETVELANLMDRIQFLLEKNTSLEKDVIS